LINIQTKTTLKSTSYPNSALISQHKQPTKMTAMLMNKKMLSYHGCGQKTAVPTAIGKLTFILLCQAFASPA
jgi:hypothetical protein